MLEKVTHSNSLTILSLSPSLPHSPTTHSLTPSLTHPEAHPGQSGGVDRPRHNLPPVRDDDSSSHLLPDGILRLRCSQSEHVLLYCMGGRYIYTTTTHSTLQAYKLARGRIGPLVTILCLLSAVVSAFLVSCHDNLPYSLHVSICRW